MYCLKDDKNCILFEKSNHYLRCPYNDNMGKKHITCKYLVEDFNDYIEKTFDKEMFNQFGKEILLYENNKYIKENIQKILDMFYSDRDIDSSMEHIKMIFYRQYALSILKEKNREL